MLHGDGEPLLFEYSDRESHFVLVAMKSDIVNFPAFSGRLEKRKYFDMETPYGYGGPITDGQLTESSQKNAFYEIRDYCIANGIVSLFLRFHPILANQNVLSSVIENRYLRDTIYMDTQDPEMIMANMDSKNRNMVRKAIKNGVTIEIHPVADYDPFMAMYNETMKKDDATDYYYFDKAYFESQKSLEENSKIFYAVKDGQPIAGAIMYYNDRFMHYHLAGTHTDFRKFSPSNLLLYEAACWASRRGIEKLHLGGGIDPDDSLFGFKKQFNKNGRIPFFVGRMIFDEEKYRFLLEERKRLDSTFDMSNGRMIQYRR